MKPMPGTHESRCLSSMPQSRTHESKSNFLEFRFILHCFEQKFTSQTASLTMLAIRKCSYSNDVTQAADCEWKSERWQLNVLLRRRYTRDFILWVVHAWSSRIYIYRRFTLYSNLHEPLIFGFLGLFFIFLKKRQLLENSLKIISFEKTSAFLSPSVYSRCS